MFYALAQHLADERERLATAYGWAFLAVALLAVWVIGRVVYGKG